MKNKIYLNIVLLFFWFNTFSQSGNNAFNEELVISINEDSISGYALIAKGPELKETIILLHGLPGNEKNLDLAEMIRQRGKNVIYFNYRGSWGSQGEFLYSNCLEDISKVVDYLSNDSVSQKLRIKKSSFSLVGHSLGGGIAILHGMKDHRVRNIVALSSFNVGEELKMYHSVEELIEFKEYLNKQFMLNIESEKFLNELLVHKPDWNMIAINSLKLDKPFIFIDENNRNEHWIKKIRNNQYVIIDSEHTFSDKRNELNLRIIEWLNNN